MKVTVVQYDVNNEQLGIGREIIISVYLGNKRVTPERAKKQKTIRT